MIDKKRYASIGKYYLPQGIGFIMQVIHGGTNEKLTWGW